MICLIYVIMWNKLKIVSYFNGMFVNLFTNGNQKVVNVSPKRWLAIADLPLLTDEN
jgi:hypothetical protein